MAFLPIAYVLPQYENFPNYWIKAYDEGTVTPKVMAIDPSGSPTVAKLELDSRGFPITVGLALVIPYVDGAYDMWLFPTEAEADADDTSSAIQIADNITGPSFTAGSDFDGADPTLANNTSAISWGAADTVNDPHTAAGPTTIQAKATELTAADLLLNPLGGTVQIGAGVKVLGQDLDGWDGAVFEDLNISTSVPGQKTRIGESATGMSLTVFDSTFSLTSSTFSAFSVVGTVSSATHPDEAFGTLFRVLTLPDRFSRSSNSAATSYSPTSADVGKYRRFTSATLVTVTLDDATLTSLTTDDEMYFRFVGAAGGSIEVSETITVNGGTDAITVSEGGVASLKFLGGVDFDYIGP